MHGLRLKPIGLVCCGRKGNIGMNALSAGAVLQQARYASFKQKQCNDDVSIENTVSKTTTNTSIELPQEIKELITGNDFWINAKTNRYLMLVRQGHGPLLLQLA